MSSSSSPPSTPERPASPEKEVSPPVSPSRTSARKNKPLVQFVLVFFLGVVTTLLHLRSARFMTLVMGDDREQAPVLLDHVVSSIRHERVSLKTDDVVARRQNANAAPRDDISVTHSMTGITRSRNRSHIPQHKNRQHQRHDKMHPSNLTVGQRKKLAFQLRHRSPIIAAGLPKTGTTSLHTYFQAIKKKHVFRSSHTYTTLLNGTKPRAGECMQSNVLHQRPMLQDCGDFQVWSDSGYAKGGDCFYPLWHGLQEFIQQYPNATIIVNTRNATQWTKSIQKWAKGSLAKRWNKCRNTPPLPKSLRESEWINFYQTYHARIRHACRQHSSLNCIEFDIQDDTAGNILEEHFGIPALNWKNCNPKNWSCNQS